MFLLSGPQRFRESGGASHRCLHCLTDHDVSQLLTGFPVSEQSLKPELERLHHEISSLSDGVGQIQRLSAETADSMRTIIKTLATEVTDCPRLFTLASTRRTGFGRWRIFEERYTLTLWCEHPSYWHSWPDATDDLHQPKSWLVDIVPYTHLVLKTLMVTVPITAAVAGAGMPKDQVERAKREIELMKTLVDKFPGGLAGMSEMSTRAPLKSQLNPAEGQALRTGLAVPQRPPACLRRSAPGSRTRRRVPVGLPAALPRVRPRPAGFSRLNDHRASRRWYSDPVRSRARRSGDHRNSGSQLRGWGM